MKEQLIRDTYKRYLQEILNADNCIDVDDVYNYVSLSSKLAGFKEALFILNEELYNELIVTGDADTN